MNIFEECHIINDLFETNRVTEARNALIRLLDYHEINKLPYSELVNHFIRKAGLYPYLDAKTANWEDRFVYELFKVNTGEELPQTLHREQSNLLKQLLEGKSLAVSAPTSFGKSFVIDAFIAIKKPQTVVIIVPTIALTDETRRRLYKKYANQYKIITTPDAELSDKNILIFPQERALSYVKRLKAIDILIIDEFYKADISFDKERAPKLLKAILELGKLSKQKYFLAPNITTLNDNPFTDGMDFVPLDFNTVFTEINECYNEMPSLSVEDKGNKLIDILNKKQTKSLIYAGTFSNIDDIISVLNEKLPICEGGILTDFSNWLKQNYHHDYILADAVKKRIGIHNGKLHRSLSQIQIKLFEESENGIDYLVSTSSIIEGVNTSAENVIIWANKNGKPQLNDFTYKNIIGRGGRMFKHFIGKVFLFEAPPPQTETQLSLPYTEELLTSLNVDMLDKDLTHDQIIKIKAFNDEMDSLLGNNIYKNLMLDNAFQNINSESIKRIASDMKKNPDKWKCFKFLNSSNPDNWDSPLYKALKYSGNIGTSYTEMVTFIKCISKNWESDIPAITARLINNDITIEKFFDMEKSLTFKLVSILNDINIIQKYALGNSIDISAFITKASNAFLPKFVYELEEYGMPRMLSKKIQRSGLINLESEDTSIHNILSDFNTIGKQKLISRLTDLLPFDKYVIDYFYSGITTKI